MTQQPKPTAHFFKGDKNIFENGKGGLTSEDQLETIKSKLSEVLDIRNFSVILGAGCSSLIEDKKEQGIPTMASLAKEFMSDEKNMKLIESFYNKLSEDSKNKISDNLERLIEILYARKFLREQSEEKKELEPITEAIEALKGFIRSKCKKRDSSQKVIDLYKTFFRKLLYRNSNLPRPNVFTTNYDLFSETALDELGVLFTNGFSGIVQRYFNPSVFNYALAERMDISGNRWGVVDNFIYLYKLHGSINWVEEEDSSKLFSVKEVQNLDDIESQNMMIYPTPAKQNSSFGSPYSDLFREFQKKLMQKDNVLMTMGYSFGDEHINNLIYQALTIPTFRLVIFSGRHNEGEIKKLKELNDSRIWIIGGDLEGDKLHYFSGIVKILPDLQEKNIDEAIGKVVANLIAKSNKVYGQKDQVSSEQNISDEEIKKMIE